MQKVKFCLYIIFISFLLPNALFSQILERPSTEIPEFYLNKLENEYRKVISLNGSWGFSSVEKGLGLTVKVPSCYDFKGLAVYTRDFNIELTDIQEWNYILYCDGINYECDININGVFIVKHEGGNTKFNSIIPNDILKESGNRIAIQVDNKLDKSKTLPLKNQTHSPRNYGGIYRDIYILAVPKVFIKDINVRYENDINNNIDIKNVINITSSELNNFYLPEDRRLYVQTEVVDSMGNVVARSSAAAVEINANTTLQITNNLSIQSPQRWSPEEPFLYTTRVSLFFDDITIVDMYTEDLGLYEVVLKTNSMTLNRIDYKLKGITYIEEMMGYGTAMGFDDVEKDVKNIKSLGFNAVNIYGRTPSSYLTLLCNKYGLFLLVNIPVISIPPKIITAENFLALAENILSETIRTTRNNPSIYGYGIGTYLNNTEERTRDYLKSMYAAAKKEDKRPVFYTTRNIEKDICRDQVDLVGFNLTGDDIKRLKDFINDPMQKKDRLFLAGYGVPISPGNLNGYSDNSSLEYQSKLIYDVNKLIEGTPFMGSFFNTYSDWFTDFPLSKSFVNNHYLRTTGLYSSSREQRPTVLTMRKVNMNENLANFNVGTFSKDSPVIFTFAGIGLFLVFVYLANSVRRFRDNIWRALFRPYIFFSDVREQSLVAPWYNILLAFILSVGNALFIATLLFYWRDYYDFDIAASAFLASEFLKLNFTYAMSDTVWLTLMITLLVFILFFIISFIIWLFSLTLRHRVQFNNIYTVTVWSFLPTIFMLITGIFYYRLINENPDFIFTGIIIAASLLIISLYRLIKGTNIVFDSPAIKTYFYGILTIVIVFGTFWYYMNTSRFFSDYLNLVLSFIKS